MQPWENGLVLYSYKTLILDYASTHRDIVERCKKNNRSAQFELYRLYSQSMYNICLRMVKNEMDAEDLLQSSFVDIFAKLHTFKYQSSIGAWIKRIVVNNCINFLKRKRLRFEEIQDHHQTIHEEVEDVVTTEFSVGAIMDALANLPDGYRVVFSLYAIEGYDHKEIAEILGVSETTSKSQYSRAKKKLKEMVSLKKSNYAAR